MAARRTMVVHTQLDSSQILNCLDKVLDRLEQLQGWSVAKKDTASAVLKVRMGFQSWGEEVVIKIQEHDYWVRSECTFPLQFFDYGKNDENTDIVYKAITESIQSIA